MLADDLSAEANLDLADIFSGLTGAFTGVDLGTVRFDASGILDLVERAAPPDLAGVLGAVDVVAGSLQAHTTTGLPGGELTGLLDSLTERLGSTTNVFPTLDPGATIGI